MPCKDMSRAATIFGFSDTTTAATLLRPSILPADAIGTKFTMFKAIEGFKKLWKPSADALLENSQSVPFSTLEPSECCVLYPSAKVDPILSKYMKSNLSGYIGLRYDDDTTRFEFVRDHILDPVKATGSKFYYRLTVSSPDCVELSDDLVAMKLQMTMYNMYKKIPPSDEKNAMIARSRSNASEVESVA